MVERLAGGEHLTAADVRVVSPALAWAAVAGESRRADALAVGDHALHHGLVTPDDLRRAVEAHLVGRRADHALAVLPHLSGLRETALESFAWSRFHDWGLPLPMMQVELADRMGRIGRVDFLWRLHRLVAEADGRLKYRHEVDLYREKLREDRIREEGYAMIRFGWPDLTDPRERLRDRLVRALHLAA